MCVSGGKNVIVSITDAVITLLKEGKEIQSPMLELQDIEQTPHSLVSDLLNEGVNDWNIKALVDKLLSSSKKVITKP